MFLLALCSPKLVRSISLKATNRHTHGGRHKPVLTALGGEQGPNQRILAPLVPQGRDGIASALTNIISVCGSTRDQRLVEPGPARLQHTCHLTAVFHHHRSPPNHLRLPRYLASSHDHKKLHDPHIIAYAACNRALGPTHWRTSTTFAH